MQRKSETRDLKVGGNTYPCTTTMLQPMRAMRLAPKLGKIIAPMLSRLRGVGSLKGLLSAERDVADLGPPLEAMFSQLDDATIDKLVPELLADTSVIVPDDKGNLCSIGLSNPAMIDIAFSGEDGLALMLAVMKFAAEVNFGRYFFANAPATKGTPTPSA